eukprot:3369803-Alexandrium_andersonii.AAC.1
MDRQPPSSRYRRLAHDRHVLWIPRSRRRLIELGTEASLTAAAAVLASILSKRRPFFIHQCCRQWRS